MFVTATTNTTTITTTTAATAAAVAVPSYGRCYTIYELRYDQCHGRFFILGAKSELISSVQVLPSECIMSY